MRSSAALHSLQGLRRITENHFGKTAKKYQQFLQQRAESGSSFKFILPEKNVDQSVYKCFVLTRPDAHNALNLEMVRELTQIVTNFQESELTKVLIFKGAGEQAFCAGGDVKNLYKWGSEGAEGKAKIAAFFREEYMLNYMLHTSPKPIMSIMNGITMGGGVGVSIHTPLSFATERTVWAMPETAIGFIPDIGASARLPKLKFELGMYLSLTGQRLQGRELYETGIATHYIPMAAVPHLLHRISDANPENSKSVIDLAYEQSFNDMEEIERMCMMLNIDSKAAHGQHGPGHGHGLHLTNSLKLSIERCFHHKTLEECFEALKAETDNKAWAQKTLTTLGRMSPLALKVTFQQMREAELKSVGACFMTDFRVANRMVNPDLNPDFQAGVDAMLISKTRNPKWKFSKIEDVPKDLIAEYFKPVPPGGPEGGELVLKSPVQPASDTIKNIPWRTALEARPPPKMDGGYGFISNADRQKEADYLRKDMERQFKLPASNEEFRRRGFGGDRDQAWLDQQKYQKPKAAEPPAPDPKKAGKKK